MEEKLTELRDKLTGDMMEDIEILSEIQEIKNMLKSEEVCDLDDGECLSCGS